MSNIYIHCENKHPGQPMPRLTYATTVVRGADAVAARERSEYERRSGARWLARDQFVAANGPERFKCPFCDKTYSAITNIYSHCRRNHSGLPMVRLTYDNTIVRPGAADAAAADAPVPPVGAVAALADDAALAADAAPVSYRAAQIHRDLARIRQERQNLVHSQARALAAADAAPAPPPPPPAAAAPPVAAMAAPARVGRLISQTGTLRGNSHYITNPVMIPNFPTSGNKLQRNSTYLDWIEGDDKNVLDALTEIQTLWLLK